MFAGVKNPKWATKAHKQIIIDVQFKSGGEHFKFVASPKDCTEYGPKLFENAKNGLYGPVEDSGEERILRGEIEPPKGYRIIDGKIINIAAKEREAQAGLEQRLAPLNSGESRARAEVDEGYAAERKTKLQALLAVKEQPGWPLEAAWPE
jgi:hypothetical protein